MALEDNQLPDGTFPSYKYEEAATKQPTVVTPHPEYDEMYEKWELPMALMGGTHEMREERTKWLPREEKESIRAYNGRLSRTYLYNAYKRTVQVLAGLPFVRAVQIDEVPEELKYLEYDCDSDNSDITDFSFNLLYDLIHYGKAHYLVDMPLTQERVTLATKDKNKVRPYFNHICPTNLISWDSEKRGGNHVLTRIRIKENVVEKQGEWGYREVQQIRVVYEDSQELWREVEKDTWDIYDILPNELGYIPLVTIYGSKTGFMTCEPPLQDLAWLNLQHYQQSSDFNNIQHYVCVPFLFGAGFEKDELNGATIAANTAISASSPDAKLGFVELNGQSIPEVRQSLDKLLEMMASLGSDLVIRKSVDRQTAASRKIDQSESISLLQIMINNVETGIERGYKIAADWLNIDAEDISVTIGDNLDTADDGPNLVDILSHYLLENKGMSVEQAVLELKRRGVLSDRFKVEGQREVADEEMVSEEETKPGETPQDDNQNVGDDD